jgi:hypothetical protein
MAANKGQGRSVGLFLVGLTTACAGLGILSGGVGTVALLIGVAITAVALWNFFQLKPLEGKIALGEQPAAAKLLGVAVVLLGWLIVLFGPHLTASVSGRMVTSIVGIVIILAGIVVILPSACNKNAIWKA